MKISRNSACPCGSGKKYKRCCGGNVSTIEDVQDNAQQISARHNNMPLQEFLGLSPTQMHSILCHPLKSPELVTFNDNWMPKDAIAMQIFNQLTDAIGEKGIKATAKGNLPLQLCRDILAAIPKGLLQLPALIHTEIEFNALNVVRIIAEIAGLIERSNTRFMLSSLGQELTQANNQSSLFNCLLKTYVSKFNWRYSDGYPVIHIIQTGWLFSLYCLSIFGNTWRPYDFYADKFLCAFPMAINEFNETKYISAKQQFYHCYQIRTLERFANFWGLIETRKLQSPDERMIEVRAPHLSEWLQFHA